MANKLTKTDFIFSRRVPRFDLGLSKPDKPEGFGGVAVHKTVDGIRRRGDFFPVHSARIVCLDFKQRFVYRHGKLSDFLSVKLRLYAVASDACRSGVEHKCRLVGGVLFLHLFAVHFPNYRVALAVSVILEIEIDGIAFAVSVILRALYYALACACIGQNYD